VIGDLAFGEPFNCVKTGELHPFIESIFGMFEVGTWITESRFYPVIGNLVFFMLPRNLRGALIATKKWAAEKAARRMSDGTDRPDFMSYILKNNATEKGMTIPEIRENAFILLVAGSETVSNSAK
jgi:hypothetical protein